jgi:hypothetical protein
MQNKQLQVTAIVVPALLIIVTLMIDAICFPESPGFKRVTRRNIQEDGIILSHRRENLKSYDRNCVGKGTSLVPNSIGHCRI